MGYTISTSEAGAGGEFFLSPAIPPAFDPGDKGDIIVGLLRRTVPPATDASRETAGRGRKARGPGSTFPLRGRIPRAGGDAGKDMRGRLSKMAGRLLALGLCLAAPAGCSKAQLPPQNQVPPEKTLLIGLIPEQNLFRQIERYEPLAGYLSGKTGVRIGLKILPRYGSVIDKFRSLELDGAFFGSFTYALARDTLGVSVIARPLAPDNTSMYHGLILVRKDSGIRTIGEMRGKRFAFVDKATTAGYLLPLHYFHVNGVSDFRTYFRETYFAGTHEDVILDVLNGKTDAGAAKNTVFRRMSEKDDRIAKELVALERSPDVPENGLALKNDVGDPLRERVRTALLTMHDDPEGKKILERFGARRFIPTTDRDYDPVYRYARDIQLGLTKYDYGNPK